MTTPTHPHLPSPPPPPRVLGFRLEDALHDIQWTRIVAAARLGLRPAMIGLCFMLLVVLALLDDIAKLWKKPQGPIADLASVFSRDSWDAFRIVERLWAAPGNLLETHGWGLVLLIPAAMMVGLFGGAACRMAALDLARKEAISWPRALGFALGRWSSMTFVLLGPAMIVGAIALLIAIAGALALGIPYVNVVGSALYALLLLIGLLGVIAAIGFGAGFPMLLPAAACEGTDAVDSLGRVFPYVTSKPLRLAFYLLLLVLTVGMCNTAAHWVVDAVLRFTAGASSTWAGPTTRAQLGLLNSSVSDAAIAVQPENASKTVGGILRFWHDLARMIPAAIGLSVFFASSTALYLAMRRAVDAQDPAEIWMPGFIEGTMARTEQARTMHQSSSTLP